MKITINKDFEETFPNEFYSGFTLGQCLAAAIGLVFSIGTAWLLWKYFGIPLVECTYIAIPLMIPFCALGFFKYQKQSLKGIISEMDYYRKSKKLLYEAGEGRQRKERVFSAKRKLPDNNRDKKAKKKKRKGVYRHKRNKLHK